jgi:hypothetical protein
MRMFGGVAIAAIVVLAAPQCIRPGIPAQPDSAEIQAPAQ